MCTYSISKKCHLPECHKQPFLRWHTASHQSVHPCQPWPEPLQHVIKDQHRHSCKVMEFGRMHAKLGIQVVKVPQRKTLGYYWMHPELMTPASSLLLQLSPSPQPPQDNRQDCLIFFLNNGIHNQKLKKLHKTPTNSQLLSNALSLFLSLQPKWQRHMLFKYFIHYIWHCGKFGSGK